jgi:hypothetical protein
MVKNSTATSRAPGTCMMEGAFQPSKVMPIGEVVHHQDIVLFCTEMIFSKNHIPHIMVG